MKIPGGVPGPYRDNEAFLLFGKELNQVLACLSILVKRNPDNERLLDFIHYLSSLRSYDDLLDQLITTDSLDDMHSNNFKRFMKDSDGMDLDELLKSVGLKRPEGGKNGTK